MFTIEQEVERQSSYERDTYRDTNRELRETNTQSSERQTHRALRETHTELRETHTQSARDAQKRHAYRDMHGSRDRPLENLRGCQSGVLSPVYELIQIPELWIIHLCVDGFAVAIVVEPVPTFHAASRGPNPNSIKSAQRTRYERT